MKITPHQVITVLRRNATHLDSPEARLVFAVIAQAVADLHVGGQKRAEAAAFISRKQDFDLYCGLIGLDADMAREVICRIGEPVATQAA